MTFCNSNYCISDFDECYSSPCQHGGACVDVINAYACTCTVGITGANCETSKYWLVVVPPFSLQDPPYFLFVCFLLPFLPILVA